jgi:hypothetical protein
MGNDTQMDVSAMQCEDRNRLNLLRIESDGDSEPLSSAATEFNILHALPNLLNCTTDYELRKYHLIIFGLRRFNKALLAAQFISVP